MTQPNATDEPLTGVILRWNAPEGTRPGRLYLDSAEKGRVVLTIWPEDVPLLQPLGDMATVEGTRISAVAKHVEDRGSEVRYKPSVIKLLAAAPEGAPPTEPRPAPRAPRAASSMDEGMAKGNATTAAAAGLFAPWMATHGDLPPEEICLEFAKRLSLTATAILSGRLTEQLELSATTSISSSSYAYDFAETTAQPPAAPPSSVQRL